MAVAEWSKTLLGRKYKHTDGGSTRLNLIHIDSENKHTESKSENRLQSSKINYLKESRKESYEVMRIALKCIFQPTPWVGK